MGWKAGCCMLSGVSSVLHIYMDRCFSRCNALLAASNRQPIDWNVPLQNPTIAAASHTTVQQSVLYVV